MGIITKVIAFPAIIGTNINPEKSGFSSINSETLVIMALEAIFPFSFV